MNLSNDFTRLVGIEYPIAQAPMGGESTPEMASAVSNSGGLGGLGCGFMPFDEIRGKIEQVQAATDKPFNVNFLAHEEPRRDPDLFAQTRNRLQPFYDEIEPETKLDEDFLSCEVFDDARVELLLELKPRVISFHLGLPSADKVQALRAAGMLIMCSASSVAEAQWLEGNGTDIIIAQGWEAGGMRATFDMTYGDFGIGGMALIPQVADAVDCPVIAAGGIADGRGVAAALILGAQGVQMGSAFLSCPEANITEEVRSHVKNARDDDTRISRAYSGRPSRVKTNRYVESMAQNRAELPDFPLMYNYSDPIKESSEDLDCVIYGQATAMNRELPAADLVKLLVEETKTALG